MLLTLSSRVTPSSLSWLCSGWGELFLPRAGLRCPELNFLLPQRGHSPGCVHPQALIAAPTSVTASSVMALHDEPGHVCSASAAASTVASSRPLLGRENPWLAPLVALSPLLALQNHNAQGVCCLWLLSDCNLPLDSRGTEGIPDLHLL